ncbi:MAG TPA: hypothetical protein VIL70_05885 [Chthoniobacterales bacterium]
MVAANTEALLADSDPLVGCDSLDEDDFLAEIGKEWNDPEFLAGAKSFKANGNGQTTPLPSDFDINIFSAAVFAGKEIPEDYGSPITKSRWRK